MNRIASMVVAGSFALAAALTIATPATAIPIPIIERVAAVTTPHESPTDRPCFIVQAHWNASLDGPQPRCPLS